MRFTATTQTCARTCTDAASATSWRWPATTGYAPRPGTTRRSTSPRPCPRSPGSASAPAPARLAFYRAHAPRPVPLHVLARVAGRRWTVLAMLAHAFLAVTAATERARAAPPAGLIPLTPNEIRRLFIGLLTRPVRDATTKPPHAPATTAAKTANSNDHDLRLE